MGGVLRGRLCTAHTRFCTAHTHVHASSGSVVRAGETAPTKTCLNAQDALPVHLQVSGSRNRAFFEQCGFRYSMLCSTRICVLATACGCVAGVCVVLAHAWYMFASSACS